MNTNSFLNKKFIIAITTIFIFITVGIISFFWTPNNPYKIYDNILGNKLISSPSSIFILGTDENGRCILSRLMISLRRLFLISFFSVSIAIFLGIIMGFISGYSKGKLGYLTYGIINIMNSIPDIIFILVIMSLVGASNISLILTIGFVSFAYPARVIRSNVHNIKTSDYIFWAGSIGASHFRIIFFHIFPNLLSLFFLCVVNLFATSILIDSAISFLGFVSPDVASIGSMLSKSSIYLTSYPLYCIVPGVVIILIVLSLNIISESLNLYLEEKKII
ncbi:MAG: ABC transporter permease [Lachnospirales bacterium]